MFTCRKPAKRALFLNEGRSPADHRICMFSVSPHILRCSICILQLIFPHSLERKTYNLMGKLHERLYFTGQNALLPNWAIYYRLFSLYILLIKVHILVDELSCSADQTSYFPDHDQNKHWEKRIMYTCILLMNLLIEHM